MKRFLQISLTLYALLMLVGCTTEVPIGYIGMVQERGGLTGKVLAPGRHACFGPGVKMILLEASENVTSEPMDILCADELNFKFDLKIRGQISGTDGKVVKNILNNKGSAAKPITPHSSTKAISYSAMYTTYIQPQARAISRGVVSKYQTTEIRPNREKIDKEVKEKIIESLAGTPMVVNMVASSNYDYPEIITKSMERKRTREIEIKEEEAKQAVKLLQATNRMKLAEKLRDELYDFRDDVCNGFIHKPLLSPPADWKPSEKAKKVHEILNDTIYKINEVIGGSL